MNNTFFKIALRFHLFWILFYFALIGTAIAYIEHLYVQYDNDQLPVGTIELITNKTEYQLEEEIVFTVINHFSTTIYVTNHCPNEPLNVFKWIDGAWMQLHSVAQEGNGECYNQERNVAIASENSRSYNFNDWPDLFTEPGVYRIAMEIDHYPDVPFQDFVILEPQEVIQVKEEPTYIHVPAKTVTTPTPVVVEEEPVIIIEEVYEEEEEDVYEEEDEYEYEDDEYEEEEHEREYEEEEDDD